MIRSARRPVLAASIVAILMTYVVVGHGLHSDGDGMKETHGAGICLVLFVLAAAVTAAALRGSPPRQACLRLVRVALPTAAVPLTPAPRARASPALLQVFRR